MTRITKLTILTIICLVLNTYAISTVQAQEESAPFVTINDMIATNKAIEIFAEPTEEWTGGSLATLGDINDDGFDDYITGAAKGPGKAYIIYGKADQQNFSLADADHIITGNGGTFASWFSVLGDVNGDGIQDIGLSAIDENGGVVYLLSTDDINAMTDQENILDIAFASITAADGGRLGHGMRGIGDFNGDGYDDLAIGEEFFGENNRGKAYIVLGRPAGYWSLGANVASFANASFIGLVDNEFLGMDIGAIGDVNGDGFTDVTIASRYGSRRASIVFGQSDPWGWDVPITEANVSVILQGMMDTPFIAEHLSGNVDLNNDGISDVIIGCYMETDTSSTELYYKYGATFIILGRTTDWPATFDRDTVDASLIGVTRKKTGWAAAGMADFNGDGYDEILTSEVTPQSSGENTIHLIPGRPTAEWGLKMNISTVAHISISSGTGSVSPGAFGNRVVDLGDVNGDGVHDIGINKWQYNGTGGLYLVHNLTAPSVEGSDSESDEKEGSVELWNLFSGMVAIVMFRKLKKTHN